MSAALSHMPFQPHENAGGVRAFVLAAVVHLALFTFLYFGVSWTNQPPAPAEAVMWTTLPPITVPTPPQPRVVPPTPPKPEPKPEIEEPKPAPPPPVKADIEVKVEKKKPEPKKEPPKKEEPKKEPPKKEPPKKEEPKKEVKPLPMDDIQRELMKEEQKRSSDKIAQLAQRETQTVSSSGASNEWGAKVAALVRSKVPINIANAVSGNPTAVFEVTLLPGREVGAVKLIKSSGNSAYDEAAQQAIQASSPLPPPTAGMQEIPRVLRFEARPKDK